MHAFDYGESFKPLDSQGFDVSCSNVANGQKAIMYFAALMYNRGKEMLDFFSDEMPLTAIAIDGMEPENDDDITLNTKRLGRASKFGGDDEDSDIGRLAKAIRGSYDNGSPQKEVYFEARIAQIKLQTE
jgi:hypothetical protein